MHFIKMHALGNDFVLIHKVELSISNFNFTVPTTPSLRNTPPSEGNCRENLVLNSPPTEGWQAKPDGVVFDYIQQKENIIQSLSNRHTGIGFDQAIIIDDFNKDSDCFTITFLNADGSHAGGCGNGTRVAAGYFHGETGKTEFNIHITLPNGGVDSVQAQILGDNLVKIKMPNPRFEASQIPISDLSLNPQALKIEELELIDFNQNGKPFNFSTLTTPSLRDTPPREGNCRENLVLNSPPTEGWQAKPDGVVIGNKPKLHTSQNGFCVNVGNPHYVMILDNKQDFLNFPLEGIGSYVEHHELFPERINVEIIFIENKNTIRMRVWERGTGITQACGTGACASVIAAVTQGLVDNKTTVVMDGGSLNIDYNPKANDLYMTGDYTFVFKGKLL